MKPYFEEDGIVIYHADCREVLPSLERADLLLTDPPYGVNGGKGTNGLLRSHKSTYQGFVDTPENVVLEIIPRIREFMAGVRRAIITPGTLCCCAYPQPDSFGCLLQPATVSFQKWGRCDSQPIFFYGADPRVGKTIQPCSFSSTVRPDENGHPCPKPYSVWRKLLHRGSVDGDMVIDPFMGSGTTLRAAKDLGRRAIGIEIEEKYCEIAAKRLAQKALQF